jgi:hypothetical protein
VNHVAVKVVEEFVLEHGVVHQVPLASGVVVALLVAMARKVQPLWVTKLIPCKDNVHFEEQIVEGLYRVNFNFPLSPTLLTVSKKLPAITVRQTQEPVFLQTPMNVLIQISLRIKVKIQDFSQVKMKINIRFLVYRVERTMWGHC